MSEAFEDAKPTLHLAPPKGFFRIQSTKTKAYLYTNKAMLSQVRTMEGTGEDQWFSAQSDGSDADQLYVRSVATGEFITLDDSPGDDKVYTSAQQGSVAKLLLFAGSGSQADQFRIFCPKSKLWAVATTNTSLGVMKKPTGDEEHAWWRFVQKDPTLVSITYKEAQGQIGWSKPFPLKTEQYSGSNQSVEVIFDGTADVTHTALWEIPPGIPRDVDGVFSMPVVANGKIVLGKPAKLKFTFGEPLSITKRWNESFKLILAPRYQAAASSSVTRSKIKVDFTARYKKTENTVDITWEVDGTYTSELTHDYKLNTEYLRAPGGEIVDE